MASHALCKPAQSVDKTMTRLLIIVKKYANIQATQRGCSLLSGTGEIVDGSARAVILARGVMTDEQHAAFLEAWSAIEKIVKEFCDWLVEWWSVTPEPIRRSLTARADRPMRKKIRRYMFYHHGAVKLTGPDLGCATGR